MRVTACRSTEHRRRATAHLVIILILTLVTGCSSFSGAHQISEPSTGEVRSPHPPEQPGSFWSPDHPLQRPAAAFGKLTPVNSAALVRDGKQVTFEIQHFTLETALPAVPNEVPVYMTGVYPPSHRDRFASSQGWEYVPQYALVSYNGTPITPPAGDDPLKSVAAVLKQRDLLMDDSAQPTVLTMENGAKAVAFFRHAGGMVVYGDKPACVTLDADGRITWLQIRRRPLLEVSLYPALTPEEAWEKLQRGLYVKPSYSVCQDGGGPLVGQISEFRVTSVELAYWEPHVDTPKQIMMPYYVFRNADGATLYVPAVASEWLAEGSQTIDSLPIAGS